MANFKGNTISTHKDDVRVVMCRFFPAGTGAPTGLVGSGVASVSRTAAGTWELVLEDAWLTGQLIGGAATIQHTTAADLVGQLGDFTDGTTSSGAKVIVRANAVATATDITANANSSVMVTLFFNNNPMA